MEYQRERRSKETRGERDSRKEAAVCKGDENRLVKLDSGSTRSQNAGKWLFVPAVSVVKPTVIG